LNWCNGIALNNNISYNNSQQKVNLSTKRLCSFCNGMGYKVGCPSFSCRKGYIHCSDCTGKKYDYNGRVCLKCKGSGIENCWTCNGRYSTYKSSCVNCNGKKYTREILCGDCQGRILSPGEKFYSEYFEGTHCLYCGGDGKTEEEIE